MSTIPPDHFYTVTEVGEMDFTGRAMKGMVYVGTEGFDSDEDLAAWVKRGVDFAASLPAKQQKPKGKAK